MISDFDRLPSWLRNLARLARPALMFTNMVASRSLNEPVRMRKPYLPNRQGRRTVLLRQRPLSEPLAQGPLFQRTMYFGANSSRRNALARVACDVMNCCVHMICDTRSRQFL